MRHRQIRSSGANLIEKAMRAKLEWPDVPQANSLWWMIEAQCQNTLDAHPPLDGEGRGGVLTHTKSSLWTPPPHPSPQGGGCQVGGFDQFPAQNAMQHLPLDGGGREGVRRAREYAIALPLTGKLLPHTKSSLRPPPPRPSPQGGGCEVGVFYRYLPRTRCSTSPLTGEAGRGCAAHPNMRLPCP